MRIPCGWRSNPHRADRPFAADPESGRMAFRWENDVPDDDLDEFELPPLIIPKKDSPECPFCGEPMQAADGDYLCLDCNGGSYGPETG